jgi:hypothetical protein
MNDLKPRSVAIDELRSDPGNARLHDERNVGAIARSLERFGQRRPLVVARGAGGALYVVAGNGTLEAARSLEWPSLLVTEVPADWDADKARAYALADNRTAELTEWDEDAIRTRGEVLFRSARKPWPHPGPIEHLKHIVGPAAAFARHSRPSNCDFEPRPERHPARFAFRLCAGCIHACAGDAVAGRAQRSLCGPLRPVPPGPVD